MYCCTYIVDTRSVIVQNFQNFHYRLFTWYSSRVFYILYITMCRYCCLKLFLLPKKPKLVPKEPAGIFSFFFFLLFDLYKKDLFKMFFRRHPNKNTFGQSAYECTWAHPYYLFLFLVFLEAQLVQQVLASTSSVTTV